MKNTICADFFLIAHYSSYFSNTFSKKTHYFEMIKYIRLSRAICTGREKRVFENSDKCTLYDFNPTKYTFL